MKSKKETILFKDDPIRRIWDEKKEKWYFSVVDVMRVLTSPTDFLTARKYWNKLKGRLKKEGNESVTKCHQLKFMAKDGKYYLSDAADAETLFRIIQSVPSPKAEPFKLWLAKVGYERLKETVDPEIALNRARENWVKMGRSKKWVEQRMRGQEIRNKLTDYWGNHEVSKKEEYAKLTDIIHEEWSGLTTKAHKNLKSLKGHNLRDHMSEAELIFTSLAELTTRNIAEKDRVIGFDKNAVSAKKGGAVAGRAKKDFELQTGNRVVNDENFLPPARKKKKITKNRKSSTTTLTRKE